MVRRCPSLENPQEMTELCKQAGFEILPWSEWMASGAPKWQTHSLKKVQATYSSCFLVGEALGFRQASEVIYNDQYVLVSPLTS